jgi:hypothetical protein
MMEMSFILHQNELAVNTLQFWRVHGVLFFTWLGYQGALKPKWDNHEQISAIRWYHRVLTGYEPETGKALLMRSHHTPAKMPRRFLVCYIWANQGSS